MKLNSLFTQNQKFVLTLIVVSQFMVSCSIFQKDKKEIPKAYSTTGAKGMTNAEARSIYIDQYKAIAIREMERTGIPASIKLAQGILESNAGRSTLSAQYNNHFGIKCHSDWQGERYYKEDDDRDPVTGQLIKSCFRAYKNGEESFIAHSEFLRDPRKVNRYGSLFQNDPKDYASWAYGLMKAGYATSSDYGDKLVRLIEDLQLHQFDLMTSSDIVSGNNPNGFPNNNTNNNNQNPSFPSSGNSGNNNMSVTEGVRNDTRMLVVNGGLTLEQVAGRYDLSLRKLQEYNEEIGEADRRLPEGTIVYTQQKRGSWSGSNKFHRVQSCETMFDISQKYGIKLSKLYGKNRMREGDQPAIGEQVVLRKGLFQSVDMPALRDTFGEWKKCRQPDILLEKPVTNPATTNRPPVTSPTNSGEFGFEITPGGTPSTQPSGSYPPIQPTSPQMSYPTQPNPYPSTETTTYPTTQPTYPTTQPTKPSTQPSTQPTTPTAGAQYYTVMQGETLWGISRKFNLTVDQLKQLNGLADNIIKPGQQLRVK